MAGTPKSRLTPGDAPLPLARSSVLDVRTLRNRMGFTQRQFAGWFGFSVATLRHWECGNRQPAGPALVLLTVIRENPGLPILAAPDIDEMPRYRRRGRHLRAHQVRASAGA